MESLKDVRGEIDRIDDEIVTLFVRRMGLLGRVAAAKVSANAPVGDPQREQEILARITSEVPPEYRNWAMIFFATLFTISKDRQREILGGHPALEPSVSIAGRDASCAAPRGDAPERPAAAPPPHAVAPMAVAVVGRGLIGGSFLMAAREAGHAVTILHHGDATGFEQAALILVCLPPDAVVPWIRAHAARFAPGAVVVDVAGVKRDILAAMSAVPRGDWHFVGGHPMAGREVSGFAHAKAELFRGASMILVPEPTVPQVVTDRLAAFFLGLGFGRVEMPTAEKHDAMIAFTSQLCHVIATAYARDPLVPESPGFSAGSYADMTRIATQDPSVWSELFLANRDALLTVLDGFLARLGEFRRGLENRDRDRLMAIIAEGAAAKLREIALRDVPKPT